MFGVYEDTSGFDWVDLCLHLSLMANNEERLAGSKAHMSATIKQRYCHVNRSNFDR